MKLNARRVENSPNGGRHHPMFSNGFAASASQSAIVTIRQHAGRSELLARLPIGL